MKLCSCCTGCINTCRDSGRLIGVVHEWSDSYYVVNQNAYTKQRLFGFIEPRFHVMHVFRLPAGVPALHCLLDAP